MAEASSGILPAMISSSHVNSLSVGRLGLLGVELWGVDSGSSLDDGLGPVGSEVSGSGLDVPGLDGSDTVGSDAVGSDVDGLRPDGWGIDRCSGSEIVGRELSGSDVSDSLGVALSGTELSGSELSSCDSLFNDGLVRCEVSSDSTVEAPALAEVSFFCTRNPGATKSRTKATAITTTAARRINIHAKLFFFGGFADGSFML